MMRTQTPASAVQTVPSVRSWLALGVLGGTLRFLGGAARWVWRLLGIATCLFVFLLIPGHASTAHDLLRILLTFLLALLACGLLALTWLREALGGLIILVGLLAVLVVDSISNHTGLHQMLTPAPGEGAPFFIFVFPFLILLSWALHTLSDTTAALWRWRVALIITPLLLAAIVLGISTFKFPVNG